VIGLLFVLLLPITAQAACGTERLVVYNRLVKKGQTDAALNLVLDHLQAAPDEKKWIRIGLAGTHEDEGVIPLSTFENGKSAVCQKAAHELALRRDRIRAQERVLTYHQEWITDKAGWGGCDPGETDLSSPKTAADFAFRCLEEGDLATYRTARQIRALLAQIPVGDSRRLRDEDFDLLIQQLQLFAENEPLLNEESTDAYYVPDLKRSDRESFCRAAEYARGTMQWRTDASAKWQKNCRLLQRVGDAANQPNTGL
jgi:hypothetical protein